MRIIAGEFRGRRLLGPEADTTRPVTDRAKQSLFDILAPLIEGIHVYDCFAGTGSMGLECLSRGAARATFFEADRSALGRLRSNIQTLGVADRSRVVPGNLFRWFDGTPALEAKDRAGLIFLDPPYRFLRERPDELRRLALLMAENHLAAEGLVIFRHDAIDALALPPLALVDSRQYGGMGVEFLRVPESRDGQIPNDQNTMPNQ